MNPADIQNWPKEKVVPTNDYQYEIGWNDCKKVAESALKPVFILLEHYSETETEIRKQAEEYLTKFEIYGDRYGVPTVGDIVELLCSKVKSTLEIKPILTDLENSAALKEVEQLMDLKELTPQQEQRLNLLVTLIQTYESRYSLSNLGQIRLTDKELKSNLIKLLNLAKEYRTGNKDEWATEYLAELIMDCIRTTLTEQKTNCQDDWHLSTEDYYKKYPEAAGRPRSCPSNCGAKVIPGD